MAGSKQYHGLVVPWNSRRRDPERVAFERRGEVEGQSESPRQLVSRVHTVFPVVAHWKPVDSLEEAES